MELKIRNHRMLMHLHSSIGEFFKMLGDNEISLNELSESLPSLSDNSDVGTDKSVKNVNSDEPETIKVYEIMDSDEEDQTKEVYEILDSDEEESTFNGLLKLKQISLISDNNLKEIPFGHGIRKINIEIDQGTPLDDNISVEMSRMNLGKVLNKVKKQQKLTSVGSEQNPNNTHLTNTQLDTMSKSYSDSSENVASSSTKGRTVAKRTRKTVKTKKLKTKPKPKPKPKRKANKQTRTRKIKPNKHSAKIVAEFKAKNQRTWTGDYDKETFMSVLQLCTHEMKSHMERKGRPQRSCQSTKKADFEY